MFLSRSCLPLSRAAASARTRLLHQSSAPASPFANLKKLSPSDSEQLFKRVVAVVGEKNASLAEAVRSQHGQDEGPDLGKNPDVVVFPNSTEEVSEVSKCLCYYYYVYCYSVRYSFC